MKHTFTLSNGMVLPAVGFGTYQAGGAEKERAMLEAIECGYRFFDTASMYSTEADLGLAIRKSGIPREEFIVETKMWTHEKGYEKTKKAFQMSLDYLQMDYVDIYMIHWPRQTGEVDEPWAELNIETWRAMEELVEEGKIKALGLSNFLPHHLDALLPHCKIMPVVNQLELHPGYSQEATLAYCKAHNIQPMAWSPLGRGVAATMQENAMLEKMAAKYGKTVQQMSLQFLVQKGILPIPKAASRKHMESNMNVFEFEISAEDISILSNMPQNAGLGEHPDVIGGGPNDLRSNEEAWRHFVKYGVRKDGQL